jgi:hypothetical protein
MSAQSSERRRHLKAVVGVSRAARDLIDAAFEAGTSTYEKIAEEILLSTGEKIGRSSIARYWREWRVQQRAREAREVALVQLADLRKLPSGQLDEVIEQLLRTNAYESLAQAEAGDIDPGKAMRALDARARRKLDEKRLELETKRLDQRGVLPIEQALEMWETIVGLVHAVSGDAGQALATVSDQVINGLKQKYA